MRVDDVLDALVGREQAEGQDDRSPLDAQPLLAAAAAGTRRDAVRDEVDLPGGHAVDVARRARAALAHDDDALREAGELVHARARCVAIGLGRAIVCSVVTTGMRSSRSSGEHVAARLAAEDPVLVLHADDVDGVDVQEVGGAAVGREVALGDLEANARRVGVPCPGSFIARTKQSTAGTSAAMASVRSVVKVAMPHCRGTWLPSIATFRILPVVGASELMGPRPQRAALPGNGSSHREKHGSWPAGPSREERDTIVAIGANKIHGRWHRQSEMRRRPRACRVTQSLRACGTRRRHSCRGKDALV